MFTGYKFEYAYGECDGSNDDSPPTYYLIDTTVTFEPMNIGKADFSGVARKVIKGSHYTTLLFGGTDEKPPEDKLDSMFGAFNKSKDYVEPYMYDVLVKVNARKNKLNIALGHGEPDGESYSLVYNVLSKLSDTLGITYVKYTEEYEHMQEADSNSPEEDYKNKKIHVVGHEKILETLKNEEAARNINRTHI